MSIFQRSLELTPYRLTSDIYSNAKTARQRLSSRRRAPAWAANVLADSGSGTPTATFMMLLCSTGD